jgi:hypothetical protein
MVTFISAYCAPTSTRAFGQTAVVAVVAKIAVTSTIGSSARRLDDHFVARRHMEEAALNEMSPALRPRQGFCDSAYQGLV